MKMTKVYIKYVKVSKKRTIDGINDQIITRINKQVKTYK